MKCHFCSTEIEGYRSVAFLQILGERVPFHLTPCLGAYQNYQHSQQFQEPVLKPAPSNE